MRVIAMLLVSWSLCAAEESTSAEAWVKKYTELSKKGHFSADIGMETKLNFGGAPGIMKGAGKIQVQDDAHIHIMIAMDVEMGGTKTATSMKMVADGKTYWTLTDGMGQKMVTKATIAVLNALEPGIAAQVKNFDITTMTADMIQSYDLQSVKLENGTVTIEGTIKEKDKAEGNPFGKIKILMDEKGVFPVSFNLSGDNDVSMVVAISNFQSVEKFADDVFRFTPEEGVTLIDLDSQLGEKAAQPEAQAPEHGHGDGHDHGHDH